MVPTRAPSFGRGTADPGGLLLHRRRFPACAAGEDEGVFLPRNILLLVYVGVGLVIASTHHYFSHIHGWRGVLSAIFAIFLWPLVLLGINLHIRK